MRILIIEDNKNLCEWMANELIEEGYVVDTCTEGDDGLRWMLKSIHDLVLLDRMLPELDGMNVLKSARSAGNTVPVIMITALDTLDNLCEGLDCGADDYISKPFAMNELLARMRALLRRPRSIEEFGKVAYQDVTLHRGQKILQYHERTCTLSKREGSLLEFFIQNPNKVLSRSRIFEYVWGPDAPVEEANLDNYIHFVRLRLKELGAPVKIKTIRGIGYQMVKEHVS